MGAVVKKTPLMMKDKIESLDPEVQMNELLNIVKLIYMDTERVMRGINAELEIYDEIIEHTVDLEVKNKYRLEQARASQKNSVNAKLVAQLIATLDRMRTVSDTEREKATKAQVVFVNDMEVVTEGSKSE